MSDTPIFAPENQSTTDTSKFLRLSDGIKASESTEMFKAGRLVHAHIALTGTIPVANTFYAGAVLGGYQPADGAKYIGFEPSSPWNDGISCVVFSDGSIYVANRTSRPLTGITFDATWLAKAQQ
ncbi:hypothetical protein [Bifidobacterium sp. ESL0745]|uniref:hypothetical protein n=1 Tax=Bifidobacterium sp. ESL0745 TaxID=2983226 RepID=UPI0023F9D5CB|nr:hypothetical protein [Bifidobacterium sp. ESL0745]MDF7665742.1 hypothetical protein [Bifidobacterium sp. ESL0745]